MDLSSDQDLSIAIMNLVSIEEHFFFRRKTGKTEYFDLLQEVRKMRGDLLRKIVKIPKAKNGAFPTFAGRSMRLMEVGTKQQGMAKKKRLKIYLKNLLILFSFLGNKYENNRCRRYQKNRRQRFE